MRSLICKFLTLDSLNTDAERLAGSLRASNPLNCRAATLRGYAMRPHYALQFLAIAAFWRRGANMSADVTEEKLSGRQV